MLTPLGPQSDKLFTIRGALTDDSFVCLTVRVSTRRKKDVHSFTVSLNEWSPPKNKTKQNKQNNCVLAKASCPFRGLRESSAVPISSPSLLELIVIETYQPVTKFRLPAEAVTRVWLRKGLGATDESCVSTTHPSALVEGLYATYDLPMT